MAFGVLFLILGYLWGLSFPINKNLWSSSYVLLTSGAAALFLGAFYFLVDVLGKKKGTAIGRSHLVSAGISPGLDQLDDDEQSPK